MDDATARALNQLNVAFYREHGDDFSARRSRPWRGFSRLLDRIPRSPLAVLDVGCGNARFGRFLAEHRRLARYVGVDASPTLLAIAERDAPPADEIAFVPADFVATPPARALPRGAFDLAVLFGVLHGVPGHERRRALLEALAERLAPGGLLVFTCWGFARDARLAGRIVPWERAPLAIDTAQLDPGDHLLPWGDDGKAFRYSATLDAQDRARLVAGLPLEPVVGFCEDGPGRNLNHYTVLRLR